jgi:hypothetical protein
MTPATTPSTADAIAAIRAGLKSQYRAALAMLRETVEEFPEDAWTSEEHVNAPWQLAYHALFFTHLYLLPSPADFRPWAGHQSRVQHEDGIAGEADPASDLPLIPQPYTKEQVLAYLEFCDDSVDGAVDALDLLSPESGFHWYPIPKLEHQLVNLRHLAHHAAQLADRLRNEAGLGTKWLASGPASGARAG